MAVNDPDLDHPDDSGIAALYREAGGEKPPMSVDSAVLRNARAAVAVKPRTAWWKPWRVPFAFAAVAVMSVSIGLIVEREGGEPLRLETPAPPAPPAAAPPSAAPTASAPAAPVPELAAAQPPAPPAGSSVTTRSEPTREDRQAAAADDALAKRRAEESARAARNETADAAAAQQQSDARGRALLRDAAPADQPKAATASRGAESESGPVPSSAAGRARMAAPPPSPAAAPADSAPPAEAKAVAPSPAQPYTVAPPGSAASRSDATPQAFPAAKPETAPPPRPLAAQRRAAQARDPAVAALIAELEPRPASEWRERVAALRRDGRVDHADALAAEFRRRFPDEPPLPDR